MQKIINGRKHHFMDTLYYELYFANGLYKNTFATSQS